MELFLDVCLVEEGAEEASCAPIEALVGVGRGHRGDGVAVPDGALRTTATRQQTLQSIGQENRTDVTPSLSPLLL